MLKPRTLLIDDIRNLDADVIVRNFREGILQLEYNGPWDLLLLDHDLASFTLDGMEQNGYHIMCFLEQNPEYLPGQIVCVSDNPVGKKRINQVIEKLYGNF